MAHWITFGTVSAMGAALAWIFTVCQWGIDQKFKRMSIALDRIQSFDATPGTRNAMMILKSPCRPIPLFDPAEPPERRYVDVTWADAKWGMIPTSYDVPCDPKTNAIRDSFEDFLNRMTQIEMYLQARILKERDVRHIVEPWVKRLDGSFDDGGLSRNFRVYVFRENKGAVVALFRRFQPEFGHQLPRDQEALDAEIAVCRASGP